MKATREATAVFFAAPDQKTLPSFSRHCIDPSQQIAAQPYVSQDDVDPKLIWNMLGALYEDEKKKKARLCLQSTKKTTPIRSQSWQETVNRRRNLVASFLQRQTSVNLKEACRYTGCDFSTVKKVHNDLLFAHEVETFEYPNTKTQDQEEQLMQSIKEVQGSYSTIADLKRLHPDYSRKLIASRLKKTGHRYLLMRKERKNPPEERHQHKKIVEVVSHLTQALNSPNTTVLYVDEMHLPLYQTSSKRWTRKEHWNDLVYNRRPAVETKLSVIALCSLEAFVAVQVFKKDVTKEDFLYFMQTVMQRFDAKTKVTILADNASWHVSESITKTRAGKFLYFNAPKVFQANAIENAFSFVRAEFRKRPLIDHIDDKALEKEAALLLNIFFMPENLARFEGIHRNHLRCLKGLIAKNSPLLAHVTVEPYF
jgi:hypothetical protein